MKRKIPGRRTTLSVGLDSRFPCRPRFYRLRQANPRNRSPRPPSKQQHHARGLYRFGRMGPLPRGHIQTIHEVTHAQYDA